MCRDCVDNIYNLATSESRDLHIALETCAFPTRINLDYRHIACFHAYPSSLQYCASIAHNSARLLRSALEKVLLLTESVREDALIVLIEWYLRTGYGSPSN